MKRSFTAAGAVLAILILLDACSKTPEASFTHTSDTYEAGDTVFFMNFSLNAENAWWQFGDGSESLDWDAWHIFPEAGTYTVSLMIYSEDRSDQTSQAIPIFELPFERFVLNPDIFNPTRVIGRDVNRDGGMDVLLTAYGSGEVLYYENDLEGEWVKRTVDANFQGAIGIDAADLDGDGDTDVLSAAWLAGQVAWYQNKGGSPVEWEKKLIGSYLDEAVEAVSGDFDGDGDVDVAVSVHGINKVLWFENRLPLEWIEHTVDPAIVGPNMIVSFDADADGDPDLALAGHGANQLLLYLNQDSGAVWNKLYVDTQVQGAFGVHFGDVDGDGDPDLVGTASLAGGNLTDLAWYENSGDALAWEKHGLPTLLSRCHTAHIADVDCDGNSDILAADADGGKLYWFRNRNAGLEWSTRIVDNKLLGANDVSTADLDGDSDPDILATARDGGEVVWYRYK
jgi:PKD repeat protein